MVCTVVLFGKSVTIAGSWSKVVWVRTPDSTPELLGRTGVFFEQLTKRTRGVKTDAHHTASTNIYWFKQRVPSQCECAGNTVTQSTQTACLSLFKCTRKQGTVHRPVSLRKFTLDGATLIVSCTFLTQSIEKRAHPPAPLSPYTIAWYWCTMQDKVLTMGLASNASG